MTNILPTLALNPQKKRMTRGQTEFTRNSQEGEPEERHCKTLRRRRPKKEVDK